MRRRMDAVAHSAHSVGEPTHPNRAGSAMVRLPLGGWRVGTWKYLDGGEDVEDQDDLPLRPQRRDLE